MKLESATDQDAFADLKSHRSTWRNALVLAHVAAVNNQFRDGMTQEEIATADSDIIYWTHELEVFDKVFTHFCGPVGWDGSDALATVDKLNELGTAIPQPVIENAKKDWPGLGYPTPGNIVDGIDISKQHHPMEFQPAMQNWDEPVFTGNLHYDPDHIVVPAKFDIECEERAWKIWNERGHGHESFARCIEAYIEDSSKALVDSLLCKDEGCPQHGTDHICVNKSEGCVPPVNEAQQEPMNVYNNKSLNSGLPRYSDNRDPVKYESLRACRLIGPAIFRDVNTTEFAHDKDRSHVTMNVEFKSFPVNIFKSEVTGELIIEPANSQRFAPIENNYKDESGGDMLQRLGIDALLWAQEFNDIAVRIGYMKMDEGWLHGWFANAMQASFQRAKDRYAPETIEIRRKRGLPNLSLSLPEPPKDI